MKTKRILSILLTLALACGLLALAPTTASAADIATPMLAAGGNDSLALKSDGTVVAWGSNSNGQLGDGTTTERHTPVQATALTGTAFTVAIAENGDTSLALQNNGTLLSCGWQKRDPLSGIKAIAAGFSHLSVVKTDGTVWGWGNNTYGNLGDGTTSYSSTPVQAQGLSGVTAIAARKHVLAVKSDGTVWAWGYNLGGEIGDGTTTDRYTPVQVPGLSNVTAVAAGECFSMALKSDGAVWGWGNNTFGQMCNGEVGGGGVPPRQVMTGVTAIAAGYGHALALKNGTVWAWGCNWNGQLGNGTTTGTDGSAPIQVSGLTGVTAIAAGDQFSMALKSDGTVWAWGDNDCGQLGDGTTTNRSTPVQVKDVGGTGWLNLKVASTTPTYTLTVNGGSGGGSYAAGAVVTITADDAPSGKVFDKWTASGVTLSSPNSASTSFTMPANAVTVTATYKNSGSSTDDEWSFWDWIIYIFFFGWLWMFF